MLHGWMKRKEFCSILTSMHIHQRKISLFMETVFRTLFCKLKLNCLGNWLSKIVHISKTLNQFIHKKKWRQNTKMILTRSKGALECLCISFSTSYIRILFNVGILNGLNLTKSRIDKKMRFFILEFIIKTESFKKFLKKLMSLNVTCKWEKVS